jgi:hypothetical protein
MEPTVTRATLRRAIGRQMRAEFFRRYPAGYVVLTGTPTTVNLYSSSLTQSTTDFWVGHYAYLATGTYAGQERLVTTFTPASDLAVVEYAFGGSPAAGDYLELHSPWPATQIHDAIDMAISRVADSFPNVVVDESLVFEQDKMQYDLTQLEYQPLEMLQVWAEKTTSGSTGVAQAGAALTITAAAGADLSDVDSNWKVSIYYGTGSGQMRNVSTASNTTKVVTITSAWDTNPDTTSYYRLWDPSKQQTPWVQMYCLRFDSNQYPSLMDLPCLYPNEYGLRFRFKYLARSSNLTSDSATTTVPQEYIIYKALSILHDSFIPDNRVDRAMHADVAQYFDQLAGAYETRKWANRPAGTLWQAGIDSALGGGNFGTDGDPLGWRG